MGTGPEGGEGPGIKVDLTSLDDFGGKVRDDVGKSLAPGTDKVTNTYKSGAPFGTTSLSEAVMDARTKYYERLLQSTNLMAAYVELAEGMAAAAERIGVAYRNADSNAMTSADRAYVEAVIGFETKVVADASAPPAERQSGPY